MAITPPAPSSPPSNFVARTSPITIDATAIPKKNKQHNKTPKLYPYQNRGNSI